MEGVIWMTVPNGQNETAPRKTRRTSPMDPIQMLLLNCLIVISVLWILCGWIVGLMNAPNEDMSPSIRAKDLLLYYRLERTYHAQDVVVLVKNDTTYIGRIVAAGGDTVDITDSARLSINGNIVSEPQIHADTPRFEGFLEYPVALDAQEYFVLCDARGGSEDSRYYGTVRSDEIRGKVVLIVRRSGI